MMTQELGALVLAQSYLWNSGGPGASSGAAIAVGVVVLGLIIFAVIRNRASISSGRSFDKAGFRRAARAAGLAEDELRFLQEYARSLGLTNADFVFNNPQRLDAFFKDVYRAIEKAADSESEAEERKALLFAARERLTHASAQGGMVRSTRQLGRGIPLTFIAPGSESYPSVVLAVEPGGVAVEPAADSYGSPLRFRRGTKLNCYFYAKGHQGYQFGARVSGWERLGGKEAMVLAHSDSVSPLPARRHARRDMRAPCSFYRVTVTAGGARGKAGKAKVEGAAYPGTIVDISAGGLGIQTAAPLQAGEYAKIAFAAGTGEQAAFAKVIRMNRLKTAGGVMHLQFVKISRQGLNAILSYVYGYAD